MMKRIKKMFEGAKGLEPVGNWAKQAEERRMLQYNKDIRYHKEVLATIIYIEDELRKYRQAEYR